MSQGHNVRGGSGVMRVSGLRALKPKPRTSSMPPPSFDISQASLPESQPSSSLSISQPGSSVRQPAMIAEQATREQQPSLQSKPAAHSCQPPLQLPRDTMAEKPSHSYEDASPLGSLRAASPTHSKPDSNVENGDKEDPPDHGAHGSCDDGGDAHGIDGDKADPQPHLIYDKGIDDTDEIQQSPTEAEPQSTSAVAGSLREQAVGPAQPAATAHHADPSDGLPLRPQPPADAPQAREQGEKDMCDDGSALVEAASKSGRPAAPAALGAADHGANPDSPGMPPPQEVEQTGGNLEHTVTGHNQQAAPASALHRPGPAQAQDMHAVGHSQATLPRQVCRARGSMQCSAKKRCLCMVQMIWQC